MLAYDFDFFWRAAGAILRGQSPYVISGFYSPYPLALVLMPLALLPMLLAYGIWTALKFLLLARAGNRWQFLRAILFFPVAYELRQGQLDLLIFILAGKLNWFGAIISTLRPQLGIWIIPLCAWRWWKGRMYDQFWKSALGVLALYGASTVIAPNWWAEWANALRVAWGYNEQSASLFGLTHFLPVSHAASFVGISALAAASFALLRPGTPREYWQLMAAFNPVAHVYSLVVLYDQVDPGVILLGLLALPLSWTAHTNAIWALIPLYLIFKDRFLPTISQRSVAAPAPPIS